jgi:hypothetical protein
VGQVTRGGDEIYVRVYAQILLEYSKKRGNLGRLAVYGRIILK